MTMTDTEAKALVRNLMLIATNKALPINYRDYATGAAHYIEATEARHAAELREQAERFSEVAVRVKRFIEEAKLSRLAYDCPDGSTPSFLVDDLTPFILPAPDPLESVVQQVARELGINGASSLHTIRADVFRSKLHAALRKIGEAGE